MALTVAQAAGVISFVVVILQLTYPLLMVLIMVGLLSDKANAVTWSLVGRFFNGSYWPTILNTDTAMTTHVNKRIVLVPMLSTAALVLLAVAAVVTPLGLHDEMTAKDPGHMPFVYIRDSSTLGSATPARDEYNISRMCGGFAWMSCPGQNHGFWMSQNSTGQYVNWDNNSSYISSVMPANLSEIFSSGRTGDMALVASPFDLQFRTYGLMSDQQRPGSQILETSGQRSAPYHVDEGRKRTVGKFAFYDSYILSNDFVVLEGVVANMATGGVGFRNHTIPRDINKGVRWTEGLLWLEPETVCVPNNVTLKTVAPTYSAGQQRNYLIDRGGLTNFTRQYPYIDLNKSQTNPNLWGRAHKAAILFNFNLRQALEINNTTNTSFVGREFTLETGISLQPGQITVGSFDNPPSPLSFDVDPSKNLTQLEISLVVQGFGGFDRADDGMIAVSAGVMYSAPQSQDGNPTTRFETGNAFVSEIYSCVTAVKAYVMDVTFFINGTASLENVKVDKAVPRTYTDNVPLWAMEKTGMNLSDISPLWGMVDDKYETADYLETLRRDFMYVPAGFGSLSFGLISSSDSLGVSLPALVLNALYSSIGDISTTGSKPDYSGAISYPLSKKWASLSSSISTMPTVFSLVWSDLMINAATCARGQLNWNYVSALNATDRARQTATVALVRSQNYVRQIGYHIDYAIPAILSLVFYLLVVLFALVFMCTRRTTFTMLRAVLNQTAVGRAVTVERHRTNTLQETRDGTVVNHNPKTMDSKDWVQTYGKHDIGISKWVDEDAPRTVSFASGRAGYEPVVTEIHVTSKG